MTNHISQALATLRNGGSIHIAGDVFAADGYLNKAQRMLIPGAHGKMVNAVAREVLGRYTLAPQSRELRELGHEIVRSYRKCSSAKTALRLLDRAVHQGTEELEHPTHQAELAKWRRYGFNEEVFRRFPDFVNYLFSTPLGSQMKLFNDEIRIIDDEPAILVEGDWTKFSDFKDLFTIEDSSLYGEKFFYHRDQRRIYTYLGNGQGLQEHHPYRDLRLRPITVLSDAELARVQESARDFVRPAEAELSDTERAEQNQGRDFVMQIVSSYVDGPDVEALKLLQRRKHPWIRIICGRDNERLGTRKGEVYEVGFGWTKPVKLPFVTISGRFRALDRWNYQSCKERVVTNIALSREEAHNAYRFAMGYHADAQNLGRTVSFNLASQNCSVFVREFARAAGIEVPTEIGVAGLIGRLAPTWIQNTYHGVDGVRQALTGVVSKILPGPVLHVVDLVKQAVSSVFDKIAGFALVIFRAITGGAMGEAGRRFDLHDSEATLEPSLWSWHNWFSLNSYRFHLPGLLQEWQREQASTQIYERPTKLSVVPPAQ